MLLKSWTRTGLGSLLSPAGYPVVMRLRFYYEFMRIFLTDGTPRLS